MRRFRWAEIMRAAALLPVRRMRTIRRSVARMKHLRNPGFSTWKESRIARSLSSGAHSRDPLASSGLQASTTLNREKSMLRLKGKIAMVVGAGSIGPGWGNGKATAVTFAREGTQVFCVDRNSTAAKETVEIITSEGGHATAFTADVSRAAEVEAMVAACLKAYGRIDVLDNNVGIAEMGSVVEVSEAAWDRVFAVNLKSAYLTMKHVIPVMERQGGGSIINISSIASIRYTGVPYATYYATKAALNHLSKTTAVEYAGKRHRVNAILPGLMKTPMVEHSAALAKSYAGGDVEEMWRARDRQVPMGYGR